jgi:hypothetical protein
MHRRIAGVLALAIACVGCKGRVSDAPGADARVEPDAARERAHRVGEACEAGATVCADEGNAALACDGGRFVVRATCGGPGGCVIDGGLACDDSIATVGDACDLEGQAACSREGASELRCTRGAFARVRVCHRSCRASADEVLCD